MVGSPGDGTGSVYVYGKNENATGYVEIAKQKLNATGATGYGNQTVFGQNTWGAAAASASRSGSGYLETL